MSEAFEPKQVSVKDIPVWLQESWGLFWRRPMLFLMTSIAFHLLVYYSKSIGILALLLAVLITQVFLMMLIRFAEATDNAKKISFWPTYNLIRSVFYSIVLLSVLAVCLYIALIIVSSYIPLDVPSVDYTETEVFNMLKWAWPGQISFLILYIAILFSTLWFLFALLTLNDELGVLQAAKLSRRAQSINEWVIFVASYCPYAVIVILLLVTEMSLLLNIVFVPLFAIYQYVSYRHVFLGKRENSPAVARASTTAAARVVS